MSTVIKYNNFETTINGSISVESARAALQEELPALKTAVAETYPDPATGNVIIEFKTKSGGLGC